MKNTNQSMFFKFTSEVEKLSSKQLLASAQRAATHEKRETLYVMAHLYEIEKRRLYADCGYASLWAYAVGEFGYSPSTASERCGAMRLMFASPFATEKVESGELTYTNALKIQRHLNQLKEDPTEEEKETLIQSICGKSIEEAEIELLKCNPHSVPKKEKIKQLTPEYSSVSFVMTEETKAKLKRFKELKGHNKSLQEIFDLTLSFYLEENDPLLKAEQKAQKAQNKTVTQNASPPKNSSGAEKQNSRYRPQAAEDAVQIRAQGQCEFISENGKRCECRTRLEYDHIKPFVAGGKSTYENLRLVCSAHNKYYAIQFYGREKMEAYFRGSNGYAGTS